MILEDVVAVTLTLHSDYGFQTMTVHAKDWQIETPAKLDRLVKLMVHGATQRPPRVSLPGGDDY